MANMRQAINKVIDENEEYGCDLEPKSIAWDAMVSLHCGAGTSDDEFRKMVDKGHLKEEMARVDNLAQEMVKDR